MVFFFLGILKQCTQYKEKDYEYRNLTSINNIDNGQPDGYLVRLAFYVLAQRDAHVIFTTSDHPDYRTDNVYEFCKQSFNEK